MIKADHTCFPIVQCEWEWQLPCWGCSEASLVLYLRGPQCSVASVLAETTLAKMLSLYGNLIFKVKVVLLTCLSPDRLVSFFIERLPRTLRFALPLEDFKTASRNREGQDKRLK